MHVIPRIGHRETEPPFQPPVAAVTYQRNDGSIRTFQASPFLKTPDSWNERYASLGDAIAAANVRVQKWEGYVTFGVVNAQAGAWLIRPLESSHGLPFAIDGPPLRELGIKSVSATSVDSALQGIVGLSSWIDFTGASKVDQKPVALPV